MKYLYPILFFISFVFAMFNLYTIIVEPHPGWTYLLFGISVSICLYTLFIWFPDDKDDDEIIFRL